MPAKECARHIQAARGLSLCLHPVEWSIGEAAGQLVAFCLRAGTSPRAVRSDPARLAVFQAELGRAGVELRWPGVGAY